MVAERTELRPPYGPTAGMLAGIELLQTSSPVRVDQDLLRTKNIAKGNEYKVIGALRFLNLIDDDLRPTENARKLHSKGAVLTSNLQKIVQDAYKGVFGKLNLAEATRDDILNYFIEDEGLPAEMASKAARFFYELAKFAEFPIGKRARPVSDTVVEFAPTGTDTSHARRGPFRLATTETRGRASADISRGEAPGLSFVLPSASLDLSEEDLTTLFRRVLSAWRTAVAS